MESLSEHDVPSDWLFQLRSWHISRVFLNGASLYNHEQMNLFNLASLASRRRSRVGARVYESSQEQRNSDKSPRKEALLSTESIRNLSSKSCCSKNYLQPFPRGKIEALRSEMYVEGGVYHRKHRQLDVHNQIHRNADGKEMITLEGMEVCPKTWTTIMGLHRSSYYRYKADALIRKRTEQHGNLGTKKPRTHTLQATAILRTLLESTADHMPHKSRTKEDGEKVVAMSLPSSFHWNSTLSEINAGNHQLGLKEVSHTGLNWIRRESFSEFSTKKRGDNFARCGDCDDLKRMRSACTRGSGVYDVCQKRLDMHIAGQRVHREHYYANRFLSEKEPEKCVTIIHDKMDHSKTSSPHFSHKSKHMDLFMKLPISVTGMISHCHGDVRYAHYGLDIFSSDSNHTVGSIAKLLRDLELPPKHSSHELFMGSRTAPLFSALLAGAEMCMSSLPPQVAEEVPAKTLPPVLNLQLDNASEDNKNRFVFAFCSLLTYHGVFQEVYINFLIVGHTHDDIDALFGRWSYKLRGTDYPTLPLLMKSFMDMESRPVIPHLIEEVPDFKKFVEGYLCTRRDALAGHTNAQQFKFYRNANGWPLMQYKLLCTDNEWLPKEGGGIRLWKETEDGSPKVPSGDPMPSRPQKMRGHDEVCKGLGGFLNLWSSMANDDFSGEFRRTNEPVSQYWRGVKAALDLPLPVEESLRDGFWPRSRFIPSAVDQFQEDGTLREEFARDVPHVGRRGDRPAELF